MSDQNIYFEHAGDTGERADAESIEPYNDGEPAGQTVFRRPPENLRYRTEVLRTAGEDGKYLQDSDMRWLISGGNDVGAAAGSLMPTVTWDKTAGSFIISNNIVVQPMSTPAADAKASKAYTFGVAPTDVVFTFTSLLFAYEGANQRRIVWEAKPSAEIPGGVCSAVVSGDPEHILTITVKDTWDTQAQDVDNALTAIAVDLVTMGISYTMVGIVSVNISALPTDADFVLNSTWERELHYITPAQIVDFFTAPANALADGDTLSIWYDWLYDDISGNNGGRRQSSTSTVDIGTGFPPNTHVTSGQMFKTTAEAEKIPLSIPLCKRIGDDLIFIDGTVVKGDAVHPEGYTNLPFSTNGYITDAALTWWVLSGYLTPHTHDGQSVSDWPIIADTLQVNLEALQVYLNDKGSLIANETATGDWAIDGDWVFRALAEFRGRIDLEHSAYIRGEAVAQNVAALLFRSNGITSDAAVEATTVSTYAFDWRPTVADPAVGTYVTLTGAWLEIDLTVPATPVIILHVAPGTTPGTRTQVLLHIEAGSHHESLAWDTTAGTTVTLGVTSPDYNFKLAPATGSNSGTAEYKGASFEFLRSDVHVEQEALIHNILRLCNSGYSPTTTDGKILLSSSQDDSNEWKLYKETPYSATLPGVQWYYKDAAGVSGTYAEPGLWYRMAINCRWTAGTPATWTQVDSHVPSRMVEYTPMGVRTYQKDAFGGSPIVPWDDTPNAGDWDDFWESEPRVRAGVRYPDGSNIATDYSTAFPVSKVFAQSFPTAGYEEVLDNIMDWRGRRAFIRAVVCEDLTILGDDGAAEDALEARFALEKIAVLTSAPTTKTYKFEQAWPGRADFGATSVYIIERDINHYIEVYVKPDGNLAAKSNVSGMSAIVWITPTTKGVY
ncbi:MAG: hypothetical protein DRP01_00325 [Archaeoglobales archaeon]|nr:MAG: hypothetical protein DRP01_00325 [Archaeoglobales archaeon]